MTSFKTRKINNLVTRRDYAKVSGNLELPNLIELQTKTFEWFKNEGITEVFNSIFPLSPNNDNNINLILNNWKFKEPKCTEEKARNESKTYESSIYANMSLSYLKKDVEIEKPISIKLEYKDLIKQYIDQKSESSTIIFESQKNEFFRFKYGGKGANQEDYIIVELINETDTSIFVNIDIFKTSDVFFGEFPLMTDRGTFIINGSEKVIVSQLVRSPGSYFKKEIDRKIGEFNYMADIIPAVGTWLEFEIESKLLNQDKQKKVDKLFSVKIDKSRKMAVTNLLTALGINSKNAMKIFNNHPIIVDTYSGEHISDNEKFNFDVAINDIYKKIKQGETAIVEGATRYIYDQLFNRRKYNLTKTGIYKLGKKLNVSKLLKDKVLAEDFLDKDGNILYKKDTEITKQIYPKIVDAIEEGAMVQEIEFSSDPIIPRFNKIQKVLVYKDSNKKEIISLMGIYKNGKDKDIAVLTVPDIVATINYALNLSDGVGEEDDIDHLGNRRVRTVGELLQNQMKIAMSRIEKNIKEKLTTSNPYDMKPLNVVNNKPLTAVIGEFFNLSQLSQFMDQINPLAEISNKRRLTALGPGGLSRDRAALEVRDIHTSHYGRICPIETPEGQNIGLINNLSTYARINEYGFIETPYRRVKNGIIIDNEIEYFTADEESHHYIAQANVNIDKDNKIIDKEVVARYKGDEIILSPTEIDFIDVSPKQIVSIGTSCIPFLENDDANRALMGANMQRQAVPLIYSDSPIVGTGIEHEIARDSGNAIIATNDGVVKYVDSQKIIVEEKEHEKVYKLSSFVRSNSGTSITHSPIVKKGDNVKKNDIIADGPSMDKGELALGQNVVVAFTTWNGYNYEDAIIVSERVIIDDVFTSIHIDEHVIERRQTKQGPEELTREIPNTSEKARKNLDEEGIIAVGTEVKAGDILVGKITAKPQTQFSPEDKLLNSIFGEKLKNVKDNSLRVPNGSDGIVQCIKRFKKTKDSDLRVDILEVIKVYIVQKRKIQEGDKMAGRHGNKGVISKVLPIEDMPHLEDGTPVDILLNPQGIPSRMNIGQILELHLGMAAKKLGIKVSTPVFEGVKENDLNEIMKEAGMTNYGRVKLIDGRTGEPFAKPISVGVMYMLKLYHMVDDKIHARNIGPYSLITQQPLGGKAQNGGQRFGEMEVWALEAYGAAHTLQEILTIKSDDIKGRIKTYEAIVRNKPIPKPGIPESFNVLAKEIKGLGFNMYMFDEQGKEYDIKARYDEQVDPNIYDFDQEKNNNNIVKNFDLKYNKNSNITFKDEDNLNGEE